jgi:serine/threonine protein kinase
LTNLQNSASSANSNQRDFQILDAENDKKLTLESFEIIEKLGKGSFGSVFLVRKKDDPEKKNYAMKVLEKDKVLAQNLIRYAKTERNVLCLAKHQFIVGLEFAFQTTSRLYLIMEYCPGGDMG